MGFVQADPIRAPARAQDLTLRPRVTGYRAGDLDARYAALPIEEDFFINYGFVTQRGPGADASALVAVRRRRANKRAKAMLEFVRERGAVHPREVDAHFSHGRVTNYWGGSSSATTHLLEAMHYKGLLRVARREGGIRIYAAHQHGARAGRRRRAPRAARRAGRHRRRDVRAAARPRACRTSSAACATPCRSGTASSSARCSARSSGSRTRASTARLVLAGRRSDCRSMREPTACACWRRSIRWCGIAGASSCSGAGRIASRPTRRCRSASSATTRCRCCGAIA